MKAVVIVLAVLVGGFAFIMIVGSMLPETPASRARDACYNLNHSSYTAGEKAQADEVCAMLRKEADRKMGRLPANAP